MITPLRSCRKSYSSHTCVLPVKICIYWMTEPELSRAMRTHDYYKGLSNSDNARLYDDAACVYCQTFYTPRALICLAPTDIRSTRFRVCFNLSSTSTFVGLSQAAHYSTSCKIVIAENFSRKLCTRVIMSKTANFGANEFSVGFSPSMTGWIKMSTNVRFSRMA